MNTARALTRFTEEQYVTLESAEVERHEYYDGHVLAMAGSSSSKTWSKGTVPVASIGASLP